MRYLYQAYGISPYSANGDTVVSNYSGNLLTKVSNNGTSLPSPGDVFSEGPNQNSSVGHTGIITAVNVTNGNGTVTTMDQNNYSDGGVKNISVVNGILQSSVTGWLHNPSGGGGSLAPPKVNPVDYYSEMDIYKRGGDGAIWKDTIQSGASSWGGWSSLSGNFASNPEADQYNSEMDVFAITASGELYQITYQPSSGWGGWTPRASGMAGDPDPIVYDGNLYVFTRGTNGNLYVTYWNGNTWVGPNQIAGNGSTQMGSSPTTTVWGGEMDTYLRGVDSNLWKAGTGNGTSWGSLGSMGGGDLENDPTAITYGGEMDVYANTTSGTLVHDTYITGWSGFNPLTGESFTGSPDVFLYNGSEMDVIDRGISNSYIYEDKWDGGPSWSGWANMAGNEESDPTAIQWGSEIDAYDTNYAGDADHDTWFSSTGWGGFHSLV